VKQVSKGGQANDSYRAVSERVSCVKKDRQITEDGEKKRLEKG
jgi:hypothetical protein